MTIDSIDHLVLTVRNIERTCDFYHRVLGMTVETFGQGRISLHFGKQKINLHALGREFAPHASKPVTGSADLCFLTEQSPEQTLQHLHECQVEVLQGPVQREGACGAITSFYFYDPDGNLLEVSHAL